MSIVPVKHYSNTKNTLENLGGVAILIVTYQCITVCNKSIKEALTRVRLSLHMSQVANQAGAYTGFCSIMRLGVFLLPPGWDASSS